MKQTRPCDLCGADFEARHPRARYCGDHCRKRARRSVVVALDTNASPVSIHSATLRELTEVGRERSAMGSVALHLARMLDDPPASVTGSMYASLSKAFRESLESAVRGATRVDAEDPLSELRRRRRDRKRGGPA